MSEMNLEDREPTRSQPVDASPAAPPRVCVVDRDRGARHALAERARAAGFSVAGYESPVALLRDFSGAHGCVLLVDQYGDEATVELLVAFMRCGWSTPVIVLTADLEPAWVVRLMQTGAFSVVERGASARRLEAVIGEAVAEDRSRREREGLRLSLRQRVDSLPPGELDVLRLVVAGLSNKLIAHRLQVSERTVECRRSSLYGRFEVNSVAQLVAAVCYADDARVPTYPLTSIGGADATSDA